MKILNLYCGLGGNRTLWGDDHDITAIEIDKDIAKIYQDRFPNDTVIICDAHEYLLKHYKEFDFIWASPPCPTHSSFRQNIGVRFRGVEAVYPDMKLYQEIIFLQHNCKCKWIVENVKPYYDYLIEPSVVLQRHPFWCNFDIEKKDFKSDVIRKAQIKDLQELHEIDLTNYKIKDKRKLLRNCVLKEIGSYILENINRGE